MPRLFISHSSRNDDWALALRDWLVHEGWSDHDDIFLDLDPDRGIAAGQRWAHALEEAATRCEAVLFIVSEAWLGSRWCVDEYQLASKLNKKLFALLIDDIGLERLPGGLTAQWQVVQLRGEPSVRFMTDHPRTRAPSPVHIAESGLQRLKRGLEKAGIGPETFELQPDPREPSGWRAPYRGLEALEPEDAAVFFGRSADIVRGIDALRGLAARKAPRLLVILGASGAGKSSFLRAGLWPRLLRDDSQWMPLRPIRASRGGAIEGNEGLLSALEDMHRRFAQRTSRSELRDCLKTPADFVALLRKLRGVAGRRALLAGPPLPLPVLCLDQAEELFGAGAGEESHQLLRLGRAAIDGDEALLLASIRSDSYGLMQDAKVLAGVDQEPLSLGPVPHGEIARIILGPSEILRRKVGPDAPTFDAAVVVNLQAEIERESDALPLLAFALERLMREHAGAGTIGLKELERTGGVSAALDGEAEAALGETRYAADRPERREALRRLFIPRLARIDRDSRAPQRRVARQRDVPADLVPLARALTQRRLLVAKVAAPADGGDTTDAATLEVAHEALLRRWPTLAELLAEDRDALLLLDGVLAAAADWGKTDAARKADYLAHRGSRLADALALGSRGPDWQRECAPASAYLSACRVREEADSAERERFRTRLQRGTIAAAMILALAAIVAGWQWRAAVQQRHQAEYLQWTAIWKALAFEAPRQKAQVGDDDLAGLLARQAYAIHERLNEQPTSLIDYSLFGAFPAGTIEHVLRGNDAAVLAVALSPDGQTLASGSWDHTVRLWNLREPQVAPATLAALESGIWSIAFSADGQRLAASTDDGSIHVWDLGQRPPTEVVLPGHSGQVHAVALSSDGRRLASASWDKTVRIWDLQHPDAPPLVLRHPDKVEAVAFRPDGQAIASGGDDKAIRIWNLSHPEEPTVFSSDAPIRSLAFAPQGQTLAAGRDDGEIEVRDLDQLQPVPVVLSRGRGAIWSIAFSPDGRRLASGSADNVICVWDLRQPRQAPLVLPAGQGDIRSVVFGPTGSRLVSGSEDTTIRVWELSQPEPASIVLDEQSAAMHAIAYSPDGHLLASGGADGIIRIWDLRQANKTPELLTSSSAIWSIAFSADGQTLASGYADATVRVWDLRRPQAPTMTLTGHRASVWSVAFSPTADRLASGSADTTIRIWDLRHPDTVPRVLLARAGFSKTTADDRPCFSSLVVASGQADFYSVAFSPDGNALAAGSADGNIRIWDLRGTGAAPTVLSGHEDYVCSVAFSPDGRTLASASGDNSIRLWDLGHPQAAPQVLAGHSANVLTVVFSPDGKRLASGGEDKTIRLWDAHEPQALSLALTYHRGMVLSVAFSPDGRSLASAGDDGTIRLWKQSALLADTECHLVWRNLSMNEWRFFLGDGIPYERTCPNLPSGAGAPADAPGASMGPTLLR